MAIFQLDFIEMFFCDEKLAQLHGIDQCKIFFYILIVMDFSHTYS